MLLPFYVFGVYGCSDDNSGDEQIQKFTLAEVDLQQNFTKEKGELSIPVSTTLDASRWDVASNQDWCIAAKDLSTSKPSIKILVKASEEPEIREAVVTVKSLVKNYEIHVKQLGYGPALLVKSSVSTLEAEGGEVSGRVAGFDETDPTTWGNPSRNDPCPCGSGRKFKHCHGALT